MSRSDRPRVSVYGAGQLGTAVADLIRARGDVEVSGPYGRQDRTVALTGGADLVVIATTTRLADVLPDVTAAVEAGANVIVSAEESAFPFAVDAEAALPDGEREWDARGYAEVIGSATLDVIGCDVGRAEGITGALRVIRLVETAGLWFNSHAWSSAVNTAASIACPRARTAACCRNSSPIPALCSTS